MKQSMRRIAALALLMALLTGCGEELPTTAPGEAETSVQTSQPVQEEAASSETETAQTESVREPETRTTEETAQPEEPESGWEAYIASDGLDSFSLSQVPAWTDTAWVACNDNSPYFDTGLVTPVSVEYYSELDSLGRCGMTYACIGTDLMPTEERGSIGSVKPTGWQTVKYDCVDGKYLYNRCHLIGYQLSGENANRQNLITGTRYLNIQGMLPFENLVADYVKETENHVAYRATPYFDRENLLAAGVLLEGWSVEDQGEGVCFCVFAYNVQPGVTIDYATGESALAGETASGTQGTDSAVTYVLNTNTMKFHNPDCTSVDQIQDPNDRKTTTESRDALIAQGYTPCGRCKP